jgi:hypothetical protein
VEDVTVIAIIVGVMLFGLLILIISLEEKLPSIKDTIILKRLKDFIAVLMLLCVPIAIVSIVVEWAKQPSGYELCMQGMNGQTDDEAIAWMEEYCSQRN